jgi:hypothetical protein
VAGRVLLCHFHVMKAWTENFLTHVPIPDKESLWRTLHVLMHYLVEEHFDDNLKKLYEDFQHISNVADYIDAGWAGESVPWRRLWPRFGRLFACGGMDTINHIQGCLWGGLPARLIHPIDLRALPIRVKRALTDHPW